MKRLLVFDPGIHTGVALFVEGELVWTETLAPPIFSTNIRSLYQQVADIFVEHPTEGTTVVIEGYPPRPSPSRESLDAIKLVGFIEGYAIQLEMDAVYVVPPVRRVSYLAQARAMTHHTRHEADAIAHGLAYYARQS